MGRDRTELTGYADLRLSQDGMPVRILDISRPATDIGRHAWMSYMVDKPPSEDKLMQRSIRPWEPAEHKPMLTASRSAFKTFNT